MTTIRPSLVVDPIKNLWNCFGACQCGGSNIDWVMKSDGVSFRHAVELLRNGHTSVLLSGDIKKAPSVRKLPSPVDLSADDHQLLEQVIDYYHETLKRTPAALEYLDMRGINNPEAINTFRLGFADRTLGIRLPYRDRKDGALVRDRLQSLGIFRSSGHEHFNGSLIMPVIDEQGRITEVYGRKINRNLRPGTAFHLYLPGPHQGIWNPACFKSRDIILCESLIDALTFWVAGFRNVTASYGIDGFTDEHLKAFIDHGVTKVLIAYDRDKAGDTAAVKLAERLLSEGIDCFRVLFPRNMDANDYALKVKQPAMSLKLLLNSAEWLGNGKRPFNANSPVDESEGGTNPGPGPGQTTDATDDQDIVSPFAADGKDSIPAVVKGDDISITFGDRHYRVRGLAKNSSFDVLRVNIRAMNGHRLHIDTLDLYNAKLRTAFINKVADEIENEPETVKRDLSRVMLKLEEIQEQRINDVLKPKKEEVVLTPEERRDAMELLKSPDLIDRIRSDFQRCGVIGESNNVLVGYLACASRKLEHPLGMIIQSSSAAGKTYLMESVLSFMPREQWSKYSTMTGQSLFYMGETDLKYKVLAIVEEEGAERASYPLKLLHSEGELTIASTGKDPSQASW